MAMSKCEQITKNVSVIVKDSSRVQIQCGASYDGIGTGGAAALYDSLSTDPGCVKYEITQETE